MNVNIIIKFSLEGIHNWPNAKDVFPDVRFLSDPHRHIFHFCCKKQVEHNDRDVEIIRFKREVMNYLIGKYEVATENLHYSYLDFENRSCEMLAEELVSKFDLVYCSVLEDNENGAEVYK